MNDFKKFKKRFLIFLIFFTLLLSIIPSVSADSEKDFYVYAGGSLTYKAYQYWKYNMTFRYESSNYSGAINDICLDGTYVYIVGATTQRVHEKWRSNMTIKQTSDVYGGNLYALAIDDTYVYAGGATIYKVFQYWKSNLTKKAETVSTGGIIRDICVDDTYVYAGGDNENVSKFYKSNLTLITSAPYLGGILALTQDDTYIYGGGGTTQKVYQWWKSNLTKKQESADYGGMIRTLANDSNYIYVAGNTVFKIFRLWKSNLTKDIESDSYGNAIISIALDNRYMYAGGYKPSGAKVFQYWLSNLTKKSESAIYGLVINTVAVDLQVAPDSPSPFTATPYGRFRIDLSWTKGWGADYTYVVAKLNSYPTGRTDGTNIYNGTGTSYSHIGLNPNEHWYYSAWSWNTTDGDWSYTNSSADATTATNATINFGTPSLANNSVGQATSLTWNIPISDTNGNMFNWTIQCSNGQSNSGNNASNGTKTLVLSGLLYNTTHTVWVNVTDIYGDLNQVVYYFTTRSADYFFTAFVPANGSTNVDIFPTLYLHVSQWEGKPFNLTWYIKPNGMSTILLSTVSNLYNGTYSINLSTLGHAELGYYAWDYEWYVIANNYTDGFQYSSGVLNYQTKSFSYESLGVEVKMDVWMIVLWLVIWAILLFVNIRGKSKIFGGFAGAWLFLLGIFIIASGVQIETGKITTTIGPGQTVEYIQYSNVVLPFNTYSYVWGVFMFVLAIYIMVANIRAKASED